MLRGLGHAAPGSLDEAPPPPEPEDVEDLAVFLVCGECGTEFRVSKLGELQIPGTAARRCRSSGASPRPDRLSTPVFHVWHVRITPVVHRDRTRRRPGAIHHVDIGVER